MDNNSPAPGMSGASITPTVEPSSCTSAGSAVDEIAVETARELADRSTVTYITEEEVMEVILSLKQDEVRFATVQNLLRNRQDQRLLVAQEKNLIAASIAKFKRKLAEQERLMSDASNGENIAEESAGNVLMFTAFSQDYSLGYICEHVNKAYCAQHGYLFRSYVLPYQEIMEAIAPKTHCTWYKVLLIRQILMEAEFLRSNNVRYIMWIDADAVVVEHGVSLQEKIAMGGSRDLIVAEDMNPGCLINAGVLLIRNSAFSRSLWDDVWGCQKYNDVFFYEQSALIRCLKSRREGLNLVKPVFHSYLPGAKRGPKLFAHVAVLEHLQLNTNRDWKKTPRKHRKKLRNERGRKATILQYLQMAEQNGEGASSSSFLFPSSGNQDGNNGEGGGVAISDVKMDARDDVDDVSSAGDIRAAHATSFNSEQLNRAVQMIESGFHGGSRCLDVSARNAIDGDGDIDDENDDDDDEDNEDVIGRGVITASNFDADKGDKGDAAVAAGMDVRDVDATDRAQFIFHPAGVADKLTALKTVLRMRGIKLPPELQGVDSFFLLRAKALNQLQIIASAKSNSNRSGELEEVNDVRKDGGDEVSVS